MWCCWLFAVVCGDVDFGAVDCCWLWCCSLFAVDCVAIDCSLLTVLLLTVLLLDICCWLCCCWLCCLPLTVLLLTMLYPELWTNDLLVIQWLVFGTGMEEFEFHDSSWSATVPLIRQENPWTKSLMAIVRLVLLCRSQPITCWRHQSCQRQLPWPSPSWCVLKQSAPVSGIRTRNWATCECRFGCRGETCAVCLSFFTT